MKCFIIAMNSEAEPVISAMKIERSFTVCGKKIAVGKLYGERAAAVICGVGKVNAAIGAQIAVDELGAETIINIGVAGGLNDGVKVGKIYAISNAVQYDFDLAQINGTAVGTLDECETNYLPLSCADGYLLKKVATGDRFNDSKDDFNLLTEVLQADVRDMECAAIAQVCMHAKIKCYAFKIISDVAGSGSTTEQYKENLRVCLNTLRGGLEDVIKSVK